MQQFLILLIDWPESHLFRLNGCWLLRLWQGAGGAGDEIYSTPQYATDW